MSTTSADVWDQQRCQSCFLQVCCLMHAGVCTSVHVCSSDSFCVPADLQPLKLTSDQQEAAAEAAHREAPCAEMTRTPSSGLKAAGGGAAHALTHTGIFCPTFLISRAYILNILHFIISIRTSVNGRKEHSPDFRHFKDSSVGGKSHLLSHCRQKSR